MARVRTAAQMQRLVALWRASGEPQARFARRHGVRPWTLWYWSRKTVRSRVSAPPTFVPVAVTPATARAALEIVVPGDVRVVVPGDTAPAAVAALVAALRTAC